MIILMKIIRSLKYYTLNMYLMLVSKFQSMLQMIVSFDVFAYSTLLLHVKVKLRCKKNGYHTALLIVKLHIVSFLPRSLSIDNIRHDVTYLSTWLLHERWRKKLLISINTYIYGICIPGFSDKYFKSYEI